MWRHARIQEGYALSCGDSVAKVCEMLTRSMC